MMPGSSAHSNSEMATGCVLRRCFGCSGSLAMNFAHENSVRYGSPTLSRLPLSSSVAMALGLRVLNRGGVIPG